MSPLASEVVPNKPLSSLEVKDLIKRDFEKMLDNFSVLGSMAAFGRSSWQIKLAFVTENQAHDMFIDSRPHPVNIIVGEGRLKRSEPAPEQFKNVESHPLKSALARASNISLTRHATSPNAERLRGGLPVPVDVKQSDGQTRQETIQYQPDSSMPENVTITEGQG